LEKKAMEKELLSEISPETSSGEPAPKIAKRSAHTTTAKGVPEVVKESIETSGQDPEAAANQEAVLEKKAIERELLSEVRPETSSGEPAPKIAETSAHTTTAKDVPEVVKESIEKSGQDPEAAAIEEAVLEKKAIERELLSEVKPETSSGEPAPKITEEVNSTVSKIAATPEPSDNKSATIPRTDSLVAPATPAKPDSRDISRDVSPGTIPGSHSQSKPTVTTGVTSATTESTSAAPPATPAKSKTTAVAGASTPSTPSSSSKPAESPAASSTTDKKNKRRSLFGRIKDKLKN
jgi:hypothetical protein